MTRIRHALVLAAAVIAAAAIAGPALADDDEQKEAREAYDKAVDDVKAKLAEATAAGKDTKTEEALLAQAAALYQKKDFVNARRQQANLQFLLTKGEEELTQSFKERGDRIGALYKELKDKLPDNDAIVAMWKEAEAEIKAGNYEAGLEKLDMLEAELLDQQRRIAEGDKPEKDDPKNCTYKSPLLKFQIDKPKWKHWEFEALGADKDSGGGVRVKSDRDSVWVEVRVLVKVKVSTSDVAEEWIERVKVMFDSPNPSEIKKTKFAGKTAYLFEISGKAKTEPLKALGLLWYRATIVQKGDFTYVIGVLTSEEKRKANMRNIDEITKSFKFVK